MSNIKDFYVTAIKFDGDKAVRRINVFCSEEVVAHDVATALLVASNSVGHGDIWKQIEVMRFNGETIKQYN